MKRQRLTSSNLNAKVLNIVKNSRANTWQGRGSLTENGLFKRISRWFKNASDVKRFLTLNGPIRIIKTNDIDKAAYFMTLGANLTLLEDKYPNNTFILEVSTGMMERERQSGDILYRPFCENRRVLKRRGRLEAGLPERFTGDHKGHKLEDIATFRHFSKREKQVLDSKS